jgi:hypothetical protein
MRTTGIGKYSLVASFCPCQPADHPTLIDMTPETYLMKLLLGPIDSSYDTKGEYRETIPGNRQTTPAKSSFFFPLNPPPQ